MRIPSRRTIWVGAAALLLVTGGWLWLDALTTMGRRVTQEKFDKVQKGMSLNEVTEIMQSVSIDGLVNDITARTWREGPNWIRVDFDHTKVTGKDIHLATFWETVQWYAKEIGITR